MLNINDSFRAYPGPKRKENTFGMQKMCMRYTTSTPIEVWVGGVHKCLMCKEARKWCLLIKCLFAA